jgi:predicted AlkP superfamily phosphohydrolase/phosphomutase/Flp pilus assembly protein TadD
VDGLFRRECFLESGIWNLEFTRRLLWRLVVATVAALLLYGCRSSDAPGRVMVLGLDGMDPETVDLLMSEGLLPNFAKLRREGAYGKLISSKPILSPIIWTTIATGKTAAEHRIGHFVAVNEKTGEQLPVTSRMRQVKALWNIFSEARRKVAVVGWWATWPAEEVYGSVVSDHTCYHFLFEEGVTGSRDTTAVTFPESLQQRIEPMIRRPGELRHEEIAEFVTVSDEEFARPFAFDDDLGHFKWAYATAESYKKIGKYLWQTERPDLLLTYIEGTDSTSHLFGHLFRAKGLAGELAGQHRRFGNAVEQMYLYADRVVGEMIEVMDDDTTLIVLSDHGFQLGALPDDPSKTRDMRRVSEKFHDIEGIIYLYGNNIVPRSRLDRPVLIDVAPTVLALAGLSPARDMRGRVLHEGLSLPRLDRVVASYETGAGPASVTAASDGAVDPAILERLRALGYFDTESPKGDRNLAAILFQEGRYAEAAAAYQALIDENPQDGALRASLAGALGALGRYDESLQQLGESIRISPLNPEAYHNRGVLFEKQGKTEQAIVEYRAALRYSPSYEPSRSALVRLVGSAEVTVARSDAERQAMAIAGQASQSARRGDYRGAMQMLDRAEELAPQLALLHQYRANVAFLMGDRAGAAAALRKALEIEPDNALFRTNLERLGDETVNEIPSAED